MKAIQTFPSLDRPILVMGMPAYPFLFLTIGSSLLVLAARFHVIALIAAAIVTPLGYLVLRTLGQRDPLALRLAAEHAVAERYYRPHAHLAAPLPRIDRRSLLP